MKNAPSPRRHRPGRRRQRGAATAMLVVLLLVMVAFALATALKMAASDITDTAAQNDSVEALFLAESALERASKRFADGTACTTAALAEPAMELGRGRFAILSAVFVSNVCRIRVQGAVGGATRTADGDATTVLFEPFPDKYADPAVLDAAWPETVEKDKGKSGYDTASASADASGSLRMRTDVGRNKKFEAYRERTLPAAIAGEQVVTLNLAYKMNYTGATKPKDQKLQVLLVDTDDQEHPIPGADFNGPSNANVWVASPTLSYTIPAGSVVDRIRLYYKLTNGNDTKAQTFIWADQVRLTTSAAAFPLKAWTEIVQ